MTNSFYSEQELEMLGFRSCGKNVLISRFARFYSPNTITIGNNVRIDDFCVLSGDITLGSFIHISAFCALYGKFGIIMEDYTGLSPRCLLFSGSDDFSGDFLISPMVPNQYTNVTGGVIHLKRFAQLGAVTTVLPNVVLEEGVAVGAMSLVSERLKEWSIFAGSPLRYIKPRKKGLLKHFNDHNDIK